MANVIVETILKVVATLLITLIGVLGTWLTYKVTKGKNLQNINVAIGSVIEMAQQTVLELQQTVVDGWKAENENGKLTDAQISNLGRMLLQKTMEKLSNPTCGLIEAAGVDITSLIQGAGEALIASLKVGTPQEDNYEPEELEDETAEMEENDG